MNMGAKFGNDLDARAQNDPHVHWIEWSVALLLVGSVCWFGLGQLTQRTHAQLIDRLQTTLDLCTRGLEQWMNERQMDTQAWAQEPQVRASVQRILALHASPSAEHSEELEAEIEQLRSHLQPICEAYHYPGFVIINKQGIQIASLLDQSLNLPIPDECWPYLRRALQGEATISVPIRSNCLLPDIHGKLHPKLPTMLALAPILNDRKEIAAVLGFRIRPEEAFSQNLVLMRPGLSGETYAFNGQGFMVSQSRFDEQLRKIGLIPEESDTQAILNVQLRDPGVNLLKGLQPRISFDQLPLTVMAKDALQGHEGSNVEGYRDYRGVPVVGAWRWLPQFGIGLTHEIDVAEAYASINSVQKIFFGVLGLMSTTTIASVLFHAKRRNTERERRRIEAELAQSLKCSKSIVDAALDAVVTIDEEGTITQWNSQAEATFGWKSREVLGRRLSDLIIPEQYRGKHELGLAAFRSTRRAPMINQRLETRGLHRAGHEFPIELSITHLPMGQEHLFSAFIRDLSVSKRAEEQERRHLSELAHVHRVNTAGQLVSELAHELNQPLAAAANYARACARFLKSDTGASREELLEWMQQAAAQTSLAFEIVGRLRELVRKETSPRAALDLSEIVRDVIALFSPEFRSRQVLLSLDLCPTLPMVSADRIQITQVLVNLIHNAIDALAEQPTDDRRLNVRTQRAEEEIEVTVSDSGCGVAPDFQSKLFEPFKTTKSQGMGLGLSISQSIIAAHGGRIWAESEVLTVFRFTLPVLVQRS
jgi:PAS domain S-box-containing protein